jgi:hypothetical protein
MTWMPGSMSRTSRTAPFLVSPALEHDHDLNKYFLRPAMIGAAQNTRLAGRGR